MDIVYDHFLALDPDEFPDGTLPVFTDTVYRRLSAYEPVFPEKFVRMFYYMRTHNWLYNYRFMEGACRGFGGLVQRALHLHEHQTACKILGDHYAELGKSYQDFFPAAKIFARNRLKEL
jgi:acyl carrier protein phosphodiesterase